MFDKKKQWFVSHPSGGLQHLPTFFKAIDEFSSLHGSIKIILPHDKEDEVHLTKQSIEASDLVIAEVSMPSTGSGIELGWASAAGKPIFLFHQGGSESSPALVFVTKESHVYVTEGHIIEVLEKLL